MVDKVFQHLLRAFFPGREPTAVYPLGCGHINETYKVDYGPEMKSYVLQKINTDIFKDPDVIIGNHLTLQNHLHKAIHNLSIPKLYSDASGSHLHIDTQGGCWRLTNFIKDSYSLDVVKEPWQAFEAGKAFGCFNYICHDLDHTRFSPAIPNFHDLSSRLIQLLSATGKDPVNRARETREDIEFYVTRSERFLGLMRNVAEGGIPLRVVHNDTKVNNILFRGEKAVAVIDLDTVGPGTLLYDYGDALRTIANTASEDEPDVSKVGFNLMSFKEFSRGYLSQTQSMLSEPERALLHEAPVLMTLIIGMRFLTDYLNGDTYFKTAYPMHNLVRCRVQQKLISRMDDALPDMKRILDEIET